MRLIVFLQLRHSHLCSFSFAFNFYLFATIGRVVGDFWLSGAAHKGIDNLVDALFGPLILLVAVSITVTLWNYSQLQPRYDDEEDDD